MCFVDETFDIIANLIFRRFSSIFCCSPTENWCGMCINCHRVLLCHNVAVVAKQKLCISASVITKWENLGVDVALVSAFVLAFVAHKSPVLTSAL